jgi:hypothetical protein
MTTPGRNYKELPLAVPLRFAEHQVNVLGHDYPPPPWSMKTMELQRREHQNPRGIRVYRQNLERVRVTVTWVRSHIDILYYLCISGSEVKNFAREIAHGFPE